MTQLIPVPTSIVFDLYFEELQKLSQLDAEQHDLQAERIAFRMMHCKDLINQGDFFHDDEGHVGFKAPDGKILLPCKYPHIKWLHNFFTEFDNDIGFCVAVANESGKYALFYLFRLEEEARQCSDFIYDDIRLVPDEKSRLYYQAFPDKNSPKFGIYNLTGDKMTPCDLDSVKFIYYEEEFLLVVEKEGKYGFISFQTSYIPPVYDEYIAQEGKYLEVRKGDRWGYLTHEGKFYDKEQGVPADEDVLGRIIADYFDSIDSTTYTPI